MFKKDPPLHINFVDQSTERRARRQTYLVAVVFVLVVAVIAAIGANASYRAANRGTTILSEIQHVPGIAGVRRLVLGTDTEKSPVQKTAFTLLLLGVGGDGHNGPQLTDTILLASVDLKEKRIAMVSIPRDMAYPLGGGQFEKINSVNAYAEEAHPGEGAVRTAEAFSKLLETPIDHVIRVDFRGFAKFIDAIGGVEIDVPQGFTDPQFPTTDDKWMTVSFKKGVQRMDGATALTYVRSRHGNNGEGSDFARSRRQQLVLLAVRKKLLSIGTLGNPTKIAEIYAVLSKHIQTDLSPWDILTLAPRAADLSMEKVTTHVLTDAPDGELVSATVNGAYMLFPRKQDWSEIRTIAQNPFAMRQATTTAVVAPVEIAQIEIKNGTARTGFAAQIAASLEKQGFEVGAFGNAVQRGYERTVIYDLTGGKKPTSLARLRKLLDASVSFSHTLVTEKVLSNNTDFLVILGEASYSMVGKW